MKFRIFIALCLLAIAANVYAQCTQVGVVTGTMDADCTDGMCNTTCSSTDTCTLSSYTVPDVVNGKVILAILAEDPGLPSASTYTLNGSGMTSIIATPATEAASVAVKYIDEIDATSGDIVVTFSAAVADAKLIAFALECAGPGSWRDQDNAEADGVTSTGAMSLDEATSQYSISITAAIGSGSGTWTGEDGAAIVNQGDFGGATGLIFYELGDNDPSASIDSSMDINAVTFNILDDLVEGPDPIRRTVDMSLPWTIGSPPGSVLVVGTDCATIQLCINDAVTANNAGAGGMEIEVPVAGGPYAQFGLKNQTNDAWIIIRPDNYANLPAIGSLDPVTTDYEEAFGNAMFEVTPAFTAGNCIAVAADGTNLGSSLASHHYRIIGIKTVGYCATDDNAVVWRVGDNSASNTVRNIIIDRSLIKGSTTDLAANSTTGLQLQCDDCGITMSQITDWYSSSSGETRAIQITNCDGPQRYEYNRISATGLSIIWGGATPGRKIICADIEFYKNFSFKEVDWYATSNTNKNVFESKHSRRLRAWANTFKDCRIDSQDTCVNFKSTNQSGGCPYCIVDDLLFDNNTIRDADRAIKIIQSEGSVNVNTNDIYIYNNLFIDIEDRAFVIAGDMIRIWINHNTVVGKTLLIPSGGTSFNTFLDLDYDGSKDMRLTNNVSSAPIKAPSKEEGDGISGNPSISGSDAWLTLTGQALVGRDSAYYNTFTGNIFPANYAVAGFTNRVDEDFTLQPSSPLAGAASDGGDIGVLWPEFNAANGITVFSEAVSTGVSISSGAALQ